jgi:hypothetical protein
MPFHHGGDKVAKTDPRAAKLALVRFSARPVHAVTLNLWDDIGCSPSRKTPITAPISSTTGCCRYSKARRSSCCACWPTGGSEFCGNPERHKYELYLAIEDLDHSRTKTKSPQTSGICERFHKTVLNGFYRSRSKKVYRSIHELQADLDAWTASTMSRDRIKGAGASAKPHTDLPWRNTDRIGEMIAA